MLFGCCIKGGADWHLQFGPLLRAVHGAKGPCAARHSVAAAKLTGWGERLSSYILSKLLQFSSWLELESILGGWKKINKNKNTSQRRKMIRFNQTDLLERGGSHWRRRRRYRISIHPSIHLVVVVSTTAQPARYLLSQRHFYYIKTDTDTARTHTHIDPPFWGLSRVPI